MILTTASDVDEFVENCPPSEINACACVVGLYASVDDAGEMMSSLLLHRLFFVCFQSITSGPGRAVS